MQINFGLQDPNAFARGLQQGRQPFDEMTATLEKQRADNALRAYASNPQGPGAINALAQVDPRLAIQQQGVVAKQASEKQERDAAVIGALARDANDAPGWDAAVDQAVAMGYTNAAQFKGKFSPQLRTAIMAAGGVKEASAEASPFSFIAGQPGAGVYVGDRRTGTLTEKVRANDGSAPAGAPVIPQEQTSGLRRVTDQATYDSVPPGEKYMTPEGVIKMKPPATNGGPTQPASGVFLP